MSSLYARPSDNVAPNATLSLAVGTINAAYPLANLVDGNPAKPAKTTGTSATFRFTFGAPQVLALVAFGPHNLMNASVTVQNNSGLSASFAMPANTEDGFSLNPWVDLTGIAVGTRTATQWDLVVTAATAPIAIGEVMLVAVKRTMPLLWGIVETEDFPTISVDTDYKSALKYWLGVKQRSFAASLNDGAFRADFYSLLRDARGRYKTFLLIPDDTLNDALFVELTSDAQDVTRVAPNVSELQLTFREVQRGLAL
jgi:hypothetical protein